MKQQYSYTSRAQSAKMFEIGIRKESADMYYNEKERLPKYRVPTTCWRKSMLLVGLLFSWLEYYALCVRILAQ